MISQRSDEMHFLADGQTAHRRPGPSHSISSLSRLVFFSTFQFVKENKKHDSRIDKVAAVFVFLLPVPSESNCTTLLIKFAEKKGEGCTT